MAARIEFVKMRSDGPIVYWNVEAYSPEGSMFPVGTGYVVDAGKVAQLSFILVADQWRRQGYGAAIIEACKSRWPNFVSTTSMDSSSELFANAVGLQKNDAEDVEH